MNASRLYHNISSTVHSFQNFLWVAALKPYRQQSTTFTQLLHATHAHKLNNDAPHNVKQKLGRMMPTLAWMKISCKERSTAVYSNTTQFLMIQLLSSPSETWQRGNDVQNEQGHLWKTSKASKKGYRTTKIA